MSRVLAPCGGEVQKRGSQKAPQHQVGSHEAARVLETFQDNVLAHLDALHAMSDTSQASQKRLKEKNIKETISMDFPSGKTASLF